MSKATRSMKSLGMQPRIPDKVLSPFGPKPKGAKRGYLINGK